MDCQRCRARSVHRQGHWLHPPRGIRRALSAPDCDMFSHRSHVSAKGTAFRIGSPATLLLLFAFGMLWWQVTSAGQRGPASFTLTVIGTNDLHGAVLPKDGRGGLELFAGYLRNVRNARVRDGGAVVLIDAGDMFQGTLESNLME